MLEVSVLNGIITGSIGLQALTITETNGRDARWAKAFAKSMGLELGDWRWNRTLQVWELTLLQKLDAGLPCAQIVLKFHNGTIGYVLGVIEYTPLFWKDKKLAKYGAGGKTVTESVYESDNNKEVYKLIRAMAYSVKDDLDPLGRATLFVHSLQRSGESVEFSTANRNEVSFVGDRSISETVMYLKKYGYGVAMYAASEGKLRYAITA